MSEPVTGQDLLDWAETLAGIARTGLGFTESLYEQERYEEILKVAAQIRSTVASEIAPEAVADEWMRMVGQGVAGYVTPKAAVGAIVSNEEKEILLVQRADSGVWLYPTGWADIGYSPYRISPTAVSKKDSSPSATVLKRTRCESFVMNGKMNGLVPPTGCGRGVVGQAGWFGRYSVTPPSAKLGI